VSALTPLKYEVINLGSDRPIVLRNVIEQIEENLGKKANITHLPQHPTDVRSTWADITKAGAHAYAAHPSTEVLMLGWSLDGAPVEVWEPHKGPIPDALSRALHDPDTLLCAFNAQFERLITRDVMGINIHPRRWRCVMVMSYYLGFSGGLDAVCEQVDIRGKTSGAHGSSTCSRNPLSIQHTNLCRNYSASSTVLG